MFQRTFYLLVAAGLLVALSAACSTPAAPALTTAPKAGAAPATAAPAGKKYQFALIVKDLANPVWLSMKAEAERAAKEEGVELATLAPVKPNNVEEQIRIMENLIQKKVDAICVVPGDSNGIVPGIEKANAANIPVINVNTQANGGKVVTFVSSDNVEAGKMAAKYAFGKIGGKGKVIILEGVPAASTAEDVKKGFMQVIQATPEITLLASQTANFARAQGQSLMENLLQRFPDVDLVLAANDEMAMGALQAIDAAGKTGKVKMMGLDATKDGTKAITDGSMLGSVDKRLDLQGYEGVKAAVRYLKGQEVEKTIMLPLILVDKTNVKDYLK